MSNEDSPSNRFGELLRESRLAKGMTLRKFAEALGVSPTYVSGVENGTLPPPTSERLSAIAQLLDVNADELIEVAGRWDDLAKQKAEESSEFVMLFRAVKDMSPDQLNQVTEAAKRIGSDAD